MDPLTRRATRDPSRGNAMHTMENCWNGLDTALAMLITFSVLRIAKVWGRMCRAVRPHTRTCKGAAQREDLGRQAACEGNLRAP